MIRRAVVALAVLWVATPCLAQKVYIDYDRDADLGSYRTFMWHKTEETSLKERSPLLHSRIVSGIEHYLTKGGMIEVTENPDVFVTYHADAEQDMKLNQGYLGYDYGDGWHAVYVPGMITTANVKTYLRGTLVIDIWDAKTNNTVWRGVVIDAVKDEPEKVARQIDKLLAKMVKEWRRMKKAEGS